MAELLLKTKLQIPPLRPNWITRSHLIERIKASAPRLALISAPAGYGKTTLAAEWCLMHPGHCAWISLEHGDNDLLSFCRYLEAALETIKSSDGLLSPFKGLLADLDTAAMETVVDQFAGRVINHAAMLPERIFLVLDDFQEVSDTRVHHLIAYLLDHCPAQLTILLLTRSALTGLPLARLRARNSLLELRSEDLSFDREESRAFLSRCLSKQLSGSDVDMLHKSTEGWVAGLQLAVLGLRGPVTEEYLLSLASIEGHIGEYLLNEVLLRQPDALQNWMLESSVVDTMNGELAEAVTGQDGGQNQLHRLEQDNLFISPVDYDRRWYRYHPMFLQMMRQRLNTTRSAEEVNQLHGHASRWYQDLGWMDEAIQHALAGKDYERAADLLSQTYEQSLWKRGESIKLRAQLNSFPADYLAHNPRMALLAAGVLLVAGEFQQAEIYLRQAEAAVDAHDMSTGMQANLLSTQAVLMRLRGELSASMKLSHQVLDTVPEQESTVRALMYFNLGVAHLKMGRLADARLALLESMRLADQNANLVLTLQCLYWLSEIEFDAGRVNQARELALEGLRLAKNSGEDLQPFVALLRSGYAELLYEQNELSQAGQQFEQCVQSGDAYQLPEVLASGLVGRARLALLRGSTEDGRQNFREARRWLTDRSTPQELRRLTAVQVNSLMRAGDLAQAHRWVSVCGLSLSDRFTNLDLFQYYLVLARFWILHSREHQDMTMLPEVQALLVRMAAVAAGSECTSLQVRTYILQALAHDAAGRADMALSSLRPALTLAAEGGYVRTFLDEGQAMLLLLKRALHSGIEPAYVRRLLDQAIHAGLLMDIQEAAPVPGWRHPQDALTERESEVLMLIAAGLSNEEIAARLVVTINTVRTHIKSINRKFGVRSRTQAIYQAQRLGLLTSG